MIVSGVLVLFFLKDFLHLKFPPPGWIIPGGKIEPEEMLNPALSAIREAREEAGVIGRRLKAWARDRRLVA